MEVIHQENNYSFFGWIHL